jgi:uncharacterized protein YndB with AHSA1/START domain
MFKVEAQREVRRPLDEVFDYVADLRNEREWNPGAVRVDKLDDGDVRAGSRFDAEYKGAGALEIEVLECQRPRMLRYLSSGRSMRLTSTIECSAAPGATSVRMRMDVEPRGMLRLASPLMRPMLQRQFAASADRLRDTLDARNSPADAADEPAT